MCLHAILTPEPSGSRPPVVSIAAHFAELKGPRFDRTKAHALLDILVIAICAIICGANDWEAVAEFGRSKVAWFKTFLALPNGILAHAVGWPIVQGGSQRFADALAAYLKSLGSEIRTGNYVRSLADLPGAAMTLFDVTPSQLIALAGDRLPGDYQRRLGRYRHGPGVCKVDFALGGPIPWHAAECLRAGTVHVGGTLDEIATAEGAAWRGEHPERPFLILGQQSLFDPSRAPTGKHTVWAYCHVPNGSAVDMTDRIAAQIERFPPGFPARVLATHTRTAAEMAAYNPNYIGGDINGGVQDLRQPFTRPVTSLNPYATPSSGYLPLFLLHPARRRCTRHVRLLRRPGHAEIR